MTHSKSKIQNPKFSLPRYPRYKDSGVEWLGEVPEHWDVQSLRAVAGLYVEKNQPDLPVLSVYREYGVILKDSRDDNHNATSLDTSNYKVVRPGDLAVNKMKAWQGSLGVSEYHGIVSPAYITCRLNQEKVTGRYIHYLLRSKSLIGALDSISYGVRVGQWDMRFEDFKKVGITIPPKPEQERIVAFLDQKTAEIDALIAKKQRQIELLDEQKAILINRAVTRGLNPDAKLKPSGIEWIGDIPEHWEVKNLKHASTAIGTGRTPSSVAQAEDLPHGVHWYTPGDYQNNGFLDASDRRAKSTRSETVETFPAGSLFYIGIGATLGRVNISLHEAGCNQQINVIVINSAAHSAEYMLHLLTSGREFIFSSSDFTTLPILNRSKTAALSIVAPPKEEQEAIAAFCADLILKIQAVQMKVTENIQSLKTLRSTLIAHAVTGRIKI